MHIITSIWEYSILGGGCQEVRRVDKERYGGFAWEIRKEKLKNFPVIFDFDKNYKLSAVTILN